MSEPVTEIKERLDIAELVGEYVQLKQAGQNLKGLCPFHQEKTPSFIVSPGRGTWHCFGCGEGGDHFSFIQRAEGVDFPAALTMLAERAGVTLSRRQKSEKTRSQRQRLFDLLEEATQLYVGILQRHEGGVKAQEYLKERGLKEKTWVELRVGYAPDAWDVTQKWLMKKGYSYDEMVMAGVVGKSERGKYFDRFRGRIIFPITDTQGRVVAFGGRIVPWLATGNEGKYVNSPETALYEKREVVYNLSRARKALRARVPCIVVEGYMDVAMLVQSGVERVVASSGTAFTEGHIKQIGRFTHEIHFAFDADAAGYQATVSATEAALKAGMVVKTISLPPGQDPADVALKNPKNLEDLFSKTESLMTVLLNQISSTNDLTEKEDRLKSAVGLLKYVRNPVLQGEMVRDISGVLHIAERVVLELLEQQRAAVPRKVVGSQDKKAVAETAQGPTALVEYQLLGMTMLWPSVRREVWPRLKEELFVDYQALMVYKAGQELVQSETRFFDISARDLVTGLSKTVQPMAEAMLTQAEELLKTVTDTEGEMAWGLWRYLKRRQLRGQLDRAQQSLSVEGDGAQGEELEKFQAIMQELAALEREVYLT